MTTSTDGQICFGILFDEDAEFPWDNDKHEGDMDEWWLYDALGFKPAIGYVFGKDNSSYFRERRKFIDDHTELPVALINYCSADAPMYIMAIPKSCLECSRGYPEIIDLQYLTSCFTQQDAQSLLDFCKEFGIEAPGAPKWYLSSYWG